MITKVAIVLLKLVLDGLCDPNLDDGHIMLAQYQTNDNRSGSMFVILVLLFCRFECTGW